MKKTLQCPICNCSFEKENKEIRRRVKALGSSVPFYCSLSCGSTAANAPRKRPFITKICECGNVLINNTDTIYCSRECASKYSFNENRRLTMFGGSTCTRFTKENYLEPSSNGLRVREWNKYDNLHHYLLHSGIPHYFEFPLSKSSYIFDLALHDLGILVEFDEKYHINRKEEDNIKDSSANKEGWIVCRIDVRNKPIPFSVELIKHLLVSYD